MKRSIENPFDYMMAETSLDSELAYKQLSSLALLKRYADFRVHTDQKQMKDADYDTRDFFLMGAYPNGDIIC